MRRWLASLLVFAAIGTNVPAQQSQTPGPGAPPPAFSEGESRSVRSVLLGEDRRLLVALPESYERTTTRYPVLYLLDGSSNIMHVTGIVRFLANARNRIPEMIVVAIPNTNRNRDLTPGIGAVLFERVLAEELMPWIDRTYRTSSERVLVGHSLGGSFTTHVFLNRPEVRLAREANSSRLGSYQQKLDKGC